MPDVPPSSAPAGWFPDGTGQLRYWDGSTWTQHVAPMVAAPEDAAPTVAIPAAASARPARAPKARRTSKASDTAATVPIVRPERQRKSPPTEGAAPAAAVADTRAGKHPVSTWIVGSVAALVLLIATLSSGLSGFLIFLGLIALATGLYSVLTGRGSWTRVITTRARGGITAGAAVLLLLIGGSVSVAASSTGQVAPIAIAATASATPTPTPSATPTPELLSLDDVASKSPIDAGRALRDAGYVVAYVLDGGGSMVPDDGMTIKSQNPAAGSRVAKGSTVIITLVAPAPAPVVEPTKAPAPAPAAPKPAPAPAAPAPAAPAPPQQSAFINPGGYCSPGDIGRVAQAKTGKSYKCGGKGADKSGDYHWNTM